MIASGLNTGRDRREITRSDRRHPTSGDPRKARDARMCLWQPPRRIRTSSMARSRLSAGDQRANNQGQRKPVFGAHRRPFVNARSRTFGLNRRAVCATPAHFSVERSDSALWISTQTVSRSSKSVAHRGLMKWWSVQRRKGCCLRARMCESENCRGWRADMALYEVEPQHGGQRYKCLSTASTCADRRRRSHRRLLSR